MSLITARHYPTKSRNQVTYLQRGEGTAAGWLIRDSPAHTNPKKVVRRRKERKRERKNFLGLVLSSACEILGRSSAAASKLVPRKCRFYSVGRD